MTFEAQQNVLAITDAYIAKVTANTSTTYTTGDKIKLPDLSSLEITVTSEKKEAKAGLKIADSFTMKTGYDVKFEEVNIPLDVLAIINGAELKTSGTTGKQIAEVLETEKQVPVMFNLEIKSDLLNGQAADIHMEMFCVKGLMDVVTTADDYWTVSFEGTAFTRKKDGAFRRIFANEENTEIVPATPSVEENPTE